MSDDNKPYDLSHIVPLVFKKNGDASLLDFEAAHQPAERDPIDDHKLPDIPWEWRRLSDADERKIGEREWIVEGWIPRRQVTGIYGPPGVNKTDFLIQALMAASEGLPFLGYKLPKMPTLGMFCEDEADEIQRRASKIAAKFGKHLSDFRDFHYTSVVGVADLEFVTFHDNAMYHGRALKRFDMMLQECGAGFACLDTAPHFFGGNENDRRQVSRFLRVLDAISITRNCGIAITAHPSARGAKVGGRMESGSTGWEGGVRARNALTRAEAKPAGASEEDDTPPTDTDARQLTRWKSNYAKPGVMLDLIWDEGFFKLATLDPETIKARGPGQKQACEAKFMELLKAVTEIGKRVHDSSGHPSNFAPRVFNARDDGRAFSVPQYVRAMRALEQSGRINYVMKSARKWMVEITTESGET